jgi:hypothetical protein
MTEKQRNEPVSVLLDETEFVPVRVLDRELACAVRGVEERLDHLGAVVDFSHQASTSRTLKLNRPAAGTGSSSESANCAAPVWKCAYFGAEHVRVNVSDFNRAVAWYESILELRAESYWPPWIRRDSSRPYTHLMPHIWSPLA